jgi:cyclopropane fatty-acyl-phospholipid synthase-like methyltransferase
MPVNLLLASVARLRITAPSMLDLVKRFITPGKSRNPGAPVSVAKAAVVPGATRPYVLWADDHDPPVPRLRCPNCGGASPKRPLLTVRYTNLERLMRFARLLHCADCTCHFYEHQKPPDYAEDAMLRLGRVPYYVQQGAGIAAITAPLARVGKPPGSRYLEVGCGFGFGLDFAVHALRWQGHGIDPGQLAALGRDMLGVTIEARCLGDEEPELKAVCDVAMAIETIERVRSPIGFARALRNVLRPGGILVLTTHDGADLQPQTAPGVLVGLLSPGRHLILQNRESLQALLQQAGFSDIVVDKNGHSLVAYASDQPFSLESHQNSLHVTYVGYLARRAHDFPPDHDLLLGFAGRALQEAANDGDIEAAERSYRMLREACQARFGMDLDSIIELPAEAATCSLERMAELMPLSLGCLLYADAMRRLAQGEARPALERRLLCAADAADALRRAVAELALEDALSEEVAWTARAEAVLCAAATGCPDIIDRVQALPPFPGGDEHRPRVIGERALVEVVNAGHHALGAALADAIGWQQEPWANPAYDADPSSLTHEQRDVLFCLAVLDLHGSDLHAYERAVRRFASVRRHIVASGKLDASGQAYWSAVQGEMEALDRLGLPDQVGHLLAAARAEAGTPPADVAATATHAATAAFTPDHLVALVNGGRYDEARLLAGALGNYASADLPLGPLSAGERDRLFGLGVLDLQPRGDPIRAARRFAAVRAGLLEARPLPALYWAALRGEIEARSRVDGAGAAEELRRQALRDLGLVKGEIPEDLCGPRQRDDETQA